MATAVGALLVAVPLLSGCANDGERQWQIAADPRATADEIIDAGHAADIATNGDHMVVTWEVEPEDDEGPYQGAWRLYGREPLQIAEGKFGTVREASARIDVTAVRGGFLLTDYAKRRQHFLDLRGRLTPAALSTAKPGSSLVGGALLESDASGEPTWQVLLPGKRQVVPLVSLPTKDVQAVALTEDGTVWVLLPWKDDGPFRVAYAKDGKAPWTTEVIPLPKGSAAGGDGFSASGEQIFVVGSHSKGEHTAVDVILSRTADDDWTTIDAAGIPENLTSTPQVTLLRRGRLLASTGGGGDWIRDSKDARFRPLRPPPAEGYARPAISSEGPWLWSAQQTLGTSLHYSYDFGRTWREFNR
jgi:hypothetical protein